MRLLRLFAEENAGNAEAQARYGIYLTQAKRYEEAERVLAQSLRLHRNCWGAHYGMTQLCMATGNQHKAKEHLRRLRALVEPAEFEWFLERL